MSKPTKRQLEIISLFEKNLNVKFNGLTKIDASIFIDEWLDDYRKFILLSKVINN